MDLKSFLNFFLHTETVFTQAHNRGLLLLTMLLASRVTRPQCFLKVSDLLGVTLFKVLEGLPQLRVLFDQVLVVMLGDSHALMLALVAGGLLLALVAQVHLQLDDLGVLLGDRDVQVLNEFAHRANLAGKVAGLLLDVVDVVGLLGRRHVRLRGCGHWR